MNSLRKDIFFNLVLFIVYMGILIALFPIIQYEIYYRTETLKEINPFWIKIRVYLSGPLCLILGVCLIALSARRIHKIVGIISVVLGIWIIIRIIYLFIYEF
jgi:hypothetical protein